LNLTGPVNPDSAAGTGQVTDGLPEEGVTVERVLEPCVWLVDGFCVEVNDQVRVLEACVWLTEELCVSPWLAEVCVQVAVGLVDEPWLEEVCVKIFVGLVEEPRLDGLWVQVFIADLVPEVTGAVELTWPVELIGAALEPAGPVDLEGLLLELEGIVLEPDGPLLEVIGLPEDVLIELTEEVFGPVAEL